MRRDLWTHHPPDLGRRALIGTLRGAILVVEGFFRSDLLMLSAALTFRVAFAIIPLFAVLLALFKGIGGEAVKEFILREVDPSPQGRLAEHIDGILAGIDATAIGIAGFAILTYTCFALLFTIEKAFNRIWGIQKPRPLLRRVTVYWTLLTLGPICIAGSLALSTFLQNHSLMSWLREHAPILDTILLTSAKFAFTWAIFLAVYLFMPNTKVRLLPALAGAVVGGTLWEWIKDFYVWYNSHFIIAYQVYGSLGAIPVFLLWVYTSWILVLFGAEVAFATQHVRTYQREIQVPAVSQRYKERLGLMLCLRVTRSFSEGAEAPSAKGLAFSLNIPVRLVNEVVFQLVSMKILREASAAPEGDPGLVPARDPSELTVQDVLDALHTHGADPFTLPEGEDMARLAALLDAALARASEPLNRVTLKALAAPPEARPD